MLSLNLALSYLKGRPTRTILTTISIVIGVMMMFGLNGVAPAMVEMLSSSAETATMANVDLFVTRKDASFFREDYLQNVAGVPGVEAVTGIVVRGVSVPADRFTLGDGTDITTIQVIGVDPALSETDFNMVTAGGRRLAEGRLLQAGDERVVVISTEFAEGLGLSLGDSIELPGASGWQPFEIVGLVNDYGLILGSQNVFMPITAAQDLLNVPGRINTIMGTYTEGSDEQALDNAIQQMFGSGYELSPLEGSETVWAALVEMMGTIFTLFGLLALALAGMIMFNTFRTSVVERRQDIGMLRAVGAPRRAVMQTILIESLLQAVSGTVIGIIFGMGFAYGIVSLMSPMMSSLFGKPMGRPEFTVGTFSLAIIFGIGIPLFSTLFPARSASRITPLEALRPMTVEQEATLRRSRLITGAIILVLALAGLFTGIFLLMSLGMLLFLLAMSLLGPLLISPVTDFFSRVLYLLFGQEGEIAAGNIGRQPRRAAITATTLMITLTVLIGLTGMFVSSIGGAGVYLEDSLRSDYILVPGAIVVTNSTVGAGPELADTLRRTRGVAEVTTLRQTDIIDSNGVGIRIVGVDPASFGRVSGVHFVDGDASAYDQLAGGQKVIVNGRFANMNGTQVGDTITVESDHGLLTFEVVAIGVDYLNMKLPTVYTDHDTLAREYGARNDMLILLNANPDADRAKLEEDLLAITKGFPGFGVISREQLQQSQNDLMGQYTTGISMMMSLLAVPALLGLANTLGINVIERTREIGTLRAVGAKRRQIRRMIVAESLLLCLMGVALGVIGGVWLSVVMRGLLDLFGIPIPYMFPTAAVITAISAGVISGILAALIPARRASDLEIVAALAYE